MRRAAHEEFVCEVIYELADWDHLKVSVKVRYGGAPGDKGNVVRNPML